MKRMLCVSALLLVMIGGASLLPSQTVTVVPTSFTNLDVNPLHREVNRFFAKLALFERLEDRVPRWVVPMLDAASTTTVLTEINRGTTAGTLFIPQGVVGNIEFIFTSAQWASDPVQGHLFITCSVDRSFDGGSTWHDVYGFSGPNMGSANCTVGPIPGPGNKFETCTPRGQVPLDGLAATWRWTLTPQVNNTVAPFTWGATATF